MMARNLQNMVSLTPEQHKAWKRLEKAFKDFKKAGGEIYTVLDTVNAYNGQYIAGVDSDVGLHTAGVLMPSITDPGFCSFADDWHGFILKEGVEVIYEE